MQYFCNFEVIRRGFHFWVKQEQNGGWIIKCSSEHEGYDKWLTVGYFKLMAIYSTLIQTHAARRASSFHHWLHGAWTLILPNFLMHMPPWNSRMMRSIPRCYSKYRKKDNFCLKLTSTGITTGTETWKWSYGSSLCSWCQQSPGKACKLEKHTKNCRQQRDVVQHPPGRKRKQDSLWAFLSSTW